MELYLLPLLNSKLLCGFKQRPHYSLSGGELVGGVDSLLRVDMLSDISVLDSFGLPRLFLLFVCTCISKDNRDR